MFVYGNWSAYDELSDSAPLDEALAMRQMDHLIRLKNRGVCFDAYLMDAFWYDPAGAYRTWKKTTWPDGPGRWLEVCLENNLLPGLWFTANTLFHLDLPSAWANSIDEKGWGMCLFQGGFLGDFMEVLHFWYERGIQLFKLDFAEFAAVPKGSNLGLSPVEARVQNVASYRSALSAFKRACPEAVILGFNGFDDRECMDRSDNPPGRYIDPAWLEVLDSIYCGDPRPSDLPSSFWRSVDFYSDAMTRLFESSGIPLARIDNCGFMAGPTGTCYWRGKAGWKEMLLLSLARGGKIHIAYGDLGLFDDSDAEWWARAQALFAPFMESGETMSLGGWPGAGQPHGWQSVRGDASVVTLVNPSLSNCPVTLPNSAQPWSLITTNSPDLETLGPGAIAVHGIACTAADLDLSESPLQAGELIGESTSGSCHDPVSINIPPASGTFRVVLTQTHPDGRALRTGYPSETEFPFDLNVTDEDGSRELPPVFSRTVWSGLSWTLAEFESRGLTLICGTSKEVSERVLTLKLFQLQDPA